MPMTYHRGGKGNHASRYTTMRKKISGQDKKRNRHDFEFLYARK